DPRAPIADVLAPQETRAYEVQAAAGQYIEIRVESEEVVRVKLHAPDGSSSAAFYDSTGDVSVLALLARESATYRLLVERVGTRPGAEICIRTTARVATAQDAARAEALRIMGETEYLPSDAASLKTQVASYEKALETWRQLGDRPLEAVTLYYLG